jgi:hypothetical protein
MLGHERVEVIIVVRPDEVCAGEMIQIEGPSAI